MNIEFCPVMTMHWRLWINDDDLEFEEEIKQEIFLNFKMQYPNWGKLY